MGKNLESKITISLILWLAITKFPINVYIIRLSIKFSSESKSKKSVPNESNLVTWLIIDHISTISKSDVRDEKEKKKAK